MHKVYLGIGGNLGNKQKNFKEVYQKVENELGEIVKTSSIYETPPWGFTSDDVFWNSVIKILTVYSPEVLLSKIHLIEKSFGRKRGDENYSSREIDIDILYFDNLYMETDELIIPHSHINKRKFVLVPLAEIAPKLKHPILQLTSTEMLEICKDDSAIKKVSEKE